MSDFTLLSTLWLLASVPWAGLMLWLTKRDKQRTLIAPHLAKAMGMQSKQPRKKGLGLITIMGLITIVALAGPSFSSQERPSYTNSSARVLVMDMSMSMYANDIKPNRLTLARYKALDLLKTWKEGSTGLVAYAGDAYQISPMTSDSQTIANQLPNLSPELMPYPGADASKGVELAIEMMSNAGLDAGDIVLITDDIDDAEKSAIESLLPSSKWRLTILGMGSRAGAPIQLNDGSLMTHDSGQPVIAKSNFDNMRQLASSVNGDFVPVQPTNSDVERISQITSQVDSANATNHGQTLMERNNQGYWLIPLLLLPALLLFRRGILLSALLAITLPLMPTESAYANPWINNDQQAMALYEQGQYDQAAELFEDPSWKGAAQYNANNFEAAIDTFKGLDNADAQYNLANAYAQSGQLEQAAELYQSLLDTNPNHQDAQHNLDVVKKALEQQQQQQQQQQQGEPSQDKSQGNNASQDAQQSQQSEQNPEQGEAQDEKSGEQEQPQDRQNDQSNGEDSEQSENASKPSDQEQQQDQTKQAANQQNDEQNSEPNSDESAEAQANPLSNQQAVDPELRKLQQVENARDPSRLLQAQMILQAQQKQPPQDTGKKW
ncbi:VWA domain-containing protein [Vibrio aquaticus]|uniref:VWA domain-containing protein n=1 Tax=Vibrio aquaticus TaxID=2496559 RepID=A0A3S0N7F3_9VIBR|nr:VWA domain-containing protein [Vibrio aquaticus]RTZ17635.1 VWA domain-containing protein [Vibrio aquaticus]